MGLFPQSRRIPGEELIFNRLSRHGPPVSELVYPELSFDLLRDSFCLWLRWVAMEDPPSPNEPPNQGMRVELSLNKNTVLGPTLIRRSDLETPLWLRANRERTRSIIASAQARGFLDCLLTIHGSIANAPFAGLYHVRDDIREAISRTPIAGTPLLQVQPSVTAGNWQVAGQAALRLRLRVTGQRVKLSVIRSEPDGNSDLEPEL